MNKLWVRLSLGFSVVVLTAVFFVALAGIVVGRAEHDGRRDDRNDRRPPREVAQLVRDLADYHRQQQSWQGSQMLLLEEQIKLLLDRRPDRQQLYFLADDQQTVVYHFDKEKEGQPLAQVYHTSLTPINEGQQVIGYLATLPPNYLVEVPPPEFFLQLLIRTLLTTAGVAAVGGIVFGIVMSRSLTAPLRDLVEAARAIGARKLSRRVEEKGSDEMIAVARAFNEMAADLEQGETLRRNLLADVAHELRTPLAVLQGNLRAILDEVYPLDQSEMARLYEQTRFLSRLVNDLHELAQAEAHQLPLDIQPTELAPLINTAVDNFRPAVEDKQITLAVELSPNLPLPAIDAARINQVLQNLLANALRHTPAEGRIAVTATAQPRAVAISVSDSGEGIPPEALPHIFDRFYRTDPARSRDKGGAGLGLAIARAIVDAHGGQLTARSNGVAGQGSTFTLTLPAAAAK